MHHRNGLRASLLLITLAAGLAAVPSAHASSHCASVALTCATTVSITVTPPSQPLKPLGAYQALPFTVTYDYEATASMALAATAVELSVAEAPAWTVVTISPATMYMPVSQVSDAQGAGSGTHQTRTGTGYLLVSANGDAPAFQQGNIVVQALARENGGLLQSTYRAAIPVMADFFSIIEANTEAAIQRAKPQAQVIYPITVTNFGNALTKVEIQVDQVPDKWQVTPPSPVTLEPKQPLGVRNSRTANLVIQTPFQNGYMNVVGAVTAKLRSAYALDPQLVGDSTIVSTMTTTKGFYVPGAEPAMLLGAVAAMAVALRGWRPAR